LGIAPETETDAERAYAARSIELSGTLALAILKDASLLDDIPNGCSLFLIPADEPEFLERSIALAISAIRAGRNVYFKHVPAGYGKDLDTDDQG
jgi:hypothetical protein